MATPGLTNGPALSGNLTMWHTYQANVPGVARGAPAALSAALDLVRAENPALSLTLTEVSLSELFIGYQLQAPGGLPDLIFASNDNLGDMARAGLTADPSGALSADELAHFSQLALDGSTVDGRLAQVPATVRAVAIYYDSTAVASFPATTAELLSAVESGDLQLGLTQAIYPVFGFWAAFGGRLMDNTGRCVADSTGVADAFAFYKALDDAGARWYSGPDASTDMAADFNSGALNAVIDGPWAGETYRDARPDSIAVAPIPAGPSGPARPMVGVDGWTINPHGAQRSLAIAFAKRMTQPDILAVLADGSIQAPADPRAESRDPLAAQFAAAIESGVARPQVTQLAGFWGSFSDALDSVLDGRAQPTAAVDAACAAMNAANGF